MPLTQTGETSWITYTRRMWEFARWGRDNGAPNYPLVKSGEALQSTDAAGTGTIDLLKNCGTAKTIVDGSATSLFDVACPAAAMVGGTFSFLVVASNGTDHQALSGVVAYSGVNKATVHTTVITQLTGEAKSASSGTLTLAFTIVTGTNKVTVKLQPTGSLTETIYTISYTVFPITGAVTIL